MGQKASGSVSMTLGSFFTNLMDKEKYSEEFCRDFVGNTVMLLIYDVIDHNAFMGVSLSLDKKENFWESEIVVKKHDKVMSSFRLKDYQKEYQDIISGRWVKGLVDDITRLYFN